MEVRSQIQEMMDDFLGLYCNPLNRINNSLLIAPDCRGTDGLQAMADLEYLNGVAQQMEGQQVSHELTADELLAELFMK